MKFKDYVVFYDWMDLLEKIMYWKVIYCVLVLCNKYYNRLMFKVRYSSMNKKIIGEGYGLFRWVMENCIEICYNK